MAENQRRGRISLWTSIAGVVLPGLVGMAYPLWTSQDILRDFGVHYGLCLLVGGVLESAALKYSLGSLDTEAGKMGLHISLASFLLMVYVTTFAVGTVHKRPAPEQTVGTAIQPIAIRHLVIRG